MGPLSRLLCTAAELLTKVSTQPTISWELSIKDLQLQLRGRSIGHGIVGFDPARAQEHTTVSIP